MQIYQFTITLFQPTEYVEVVYQLYNGNIGEYNDIIAAAIFKRNNVAIIQNDADSAEFVVTICPWRRACLHLLNICPPCLHCLISYWWCHNLHPRRILHIDPRIDSSYGKISYLFSCRLPPPSAVQLYYSRLYAVHCSTFCYAFNMSLKGVRALNSKIVLVAVYTTATRTQLLPPLH